MKITKKAVVPGALIMLLSTAVILLVFLNVSVMGTSSTNSYVAQSQFDSFAVKLKNSYYLMQYVDRYILPKGYMIAQFYFPSSQCYQDTNQLCEVGAKYDEKNKICYKEPEFLGNLKIISDTNQYSCQIKQVDKNLKLGILYDFGDGEKLYSKEELKKNLLYACPEGYSFVENNNRYCEAELIFKGTKEEVLWETSYLIENKEGYKNGYYTCPFSPTYHSLSLDYPDSDKWLCMSAFIVPTNQRCSFDTSRRYTYDSDKDTCFYFLSSQTDFDCSKYNDGTHEYFIHNFISNNIYTYTNDFSACYYETTRGCTGEIILGLCSTLKVGPVCPSNLEPSYLFLSSSSLQPICIKHFDTFECKLDGEENFYLGKCTKEPLLVEGECILENTCEDSYTFNINRNRCEKEPAPTTAWFYDYCKSGASCENSACLCLITTSGTPEKLSSKSDGFTNLITSLQKSNTYLYTKEKTAYYPVLERDSLNLMSLTSSFTKSFFDTYYVLPKIISCQRISSTEEPLTLMKIDENGNEKLLFLIEQCTKLSSITMGSAEAPNQYINWKTEQNCTD